MGVERRSSSYGSYRVLCAVARTSSSVAFFLNPKSLRISPQYHVIFYDNFSAIPRTKNGEIPPHWTDLVKQNSESATDVTIDLTNTWAAEV